VLDGKENPINSGIGGGLDKSTRGGRDGPQPFL
jgi:hypothetical protein